ncbi:hypothetical protein C5167_029499 [Papaver somniferum]|nr:hypothetical protein C5167_041436 [Papaver somniferum]RZC92770.1 hypothetical protein C5167_029499 [Papaver somniferum]
MDANTTQSEAATEIGSSIHPTSIPAPSADAQQAAQSAPTEATNNAGDVSAKPKSSSKVWNEFIKLNGEWAECKHCKKKLKAGSQKNGTSGLWKHSPRILIRSRPGFSSAGGGQSTNFHSPPHHHPFNHQSRHSPPPYNHSQGGGGDGAGFRPMVGDASGGSHGMRISGHLFSLLEEGLHQRDKYILLVYHSCCGVESFMRLGVTVPLLAAQSPSKRGREHVLRPMGGAASSLNGGGTSESWNANFCTEKTCYSSMNLGYASLPSGFHVLRILILVLLLVLGIQFGDLQFDGGKKHSGTRRALALAGAETYCKYCGLKGENIVAKTIGAIWTLKDYPLPGVVSQGPCLLHWLNQLSSVQNNSLNWWY